MNSYLTLDDALLFFPNASDYEPEQQTNALEVSFSLVNSFLDSTLKVPAIDESGAIPGILKLMQARFFQYVLESSNHGYSDELKNLFDATSETLKKITQNELIVSEVQITQPEIGWTVTEINTADGYIYAGGVAPELITNLIFTVPVKSVSNPSDYFHVSLYTGTTYINVVNPGEGWYSPNSIKVGDEIEIVDTAPDDMGFGISPDLGLYRVSAIEDLGYLSFHLSHKLVDGVWVEFTGFAENSEDMMHNMILINRYHRTEDGIPLNVKSGDKRISEFIFTATYDWQTIPNSNLEIRVEGDFRDGESFEVKGVPDTKNVVSAKPVFQQVEVYYG